jgi:hypothetical protein
LTCDVCLKYRVGFIMIGSRGESYLLGHGRWSLGKAGMGILDAYMGRRVWRRKHSVKVAPASEAPQRASRAATTSRRIRREVLSPRGGDRHGRRSQFSWKSVLM